MTVGIVASLGTVEDYFPTLHNLFIPSELTASRRSGYAFSPCSASEETCVASGALWVSSSVSDSIV